MSRVLETFDPNETLAAWDSAAPQQEHLGWKTYKCRLVTPMYGGGVHAGHIDPQMPVRVSSIRGQLRFWWRVACGPFSSSRDMFARESALWGGISQEGPPTASRVFVRVNCGPVGDEQLVPSNAEHDPGVKYAFGPATINGVTQWLRPGYSFDLSLRYPSEWGADVELALRWWASFGGLGARTRRGFGAVRVEGLDPVSVGQVSAAACQITVTTQGSAYADAEWKRSIGRLYAFRQKGGTGRRAGNPRPGRSYWPEPDQLRRFTDKDANGRHIPVHRAGNCFPRAAFGLPILFDFMNAPGEPHKTELLPAGGEDRMASPLILRPYWNGQRWHATALLLPWWRSAVEMPLRLNGENFNPAHWPTDPGARGAKANAIEPMQHRGAVLADDPLSAFMRFFKET